MILVTGATGGYGSNAIQHLLKKGINPSDISALVRDESKAGSLSAQGITVKTGDYHDFDSLVKSFAGVDKLLFVSGSEIANRLSQHTNVVKAAQTAGVNHIVYTSFIRQVPVRNSAIAFLQESHASTEKLIRESGLNYTILQNATYMDLIPMFLGEKVIETEGFIVSAKEGRSGWVLRTELAEAAAHVLTTENHINKSYVLSNSESVSFGQIAQALSQTSNKKIIYQSPTVEEYKSTMKTYGVPDAFINLFSAFAVAQAQGELDLQDDTLTSFLGRKPVSVSNFIVQTYT